MGLGMSWFTDKFQMEAFNSKPYVQWLQFNLFFMTPYSLMTTFSVFRFMQVSRSNESVATWPQDSLESSK